MVLLFIIHNTSFSFLLGGRCFSGKKRGAIDLPCQHCKLHCKLLHQRQRMHVCTWMHSPWVSFNVNGLDQFRAINVNVKNTKEFMSQ